MPDLAHIIVKLNVYVCVFALITFPKSGLGQEAGPAAACVFQDLNLPGAFSSAGTGINDVGGIVGAFSPGLRTSSQAFLLFQSRFTPFTFPGSTASGASDINDFAQIVGSYRDGSGLQHGFLVHSGSFQSIDVPGAVNGTVLMGINNTGDIVGGVFGASGGERAFLLHQGKVAFFSFPGSAATEAASININSLIVGTYRTMVVGGEIHGFTVRHGVFTTLDFPGAVNTFPAKVNDQGVIVGSYQSSDLTQHGFAFAHGQFTTIDRPNQPPATQPQTNILGVNNLGVIVGSFSNSNIIGALGFQADCRTVF